MLTDVDLNRVAAIDDVDLYYYPLLLIHYVVVDINIGALSRLPLE
jgi:hypothetical protein